MFQRFRIFLPLITAAAAMLGGCATTAQSTAPAGPAAPVAKGAAPAAQPGSAAQAAATGAASGESGLTEPELYEFLLGEIALQRGDAQIAARSYVDLARRTRDPRIARRAVEVANYARQPELALEAAKLWHEVEPSSAHALQAVAALLVDTGRVEEAEPYLAKLLDAKDVNVENGFLQLNRLLAGNADKKANLRVVRQLAALHPQVPQAHFAVAQAAAAAGEDDEALAAIRRASQLSPDWDAAAVFEAQLLQPRSPQQAERRLSSFLDAHPQSREARLAYARLLVLDRRLPEARKQFDALLAANPNNPDIVYAVGLLAMELKDYPVAEQNMKRLLGLGYRDPDAVRYILGQIEEDQKHWAKAIGWYQQIKSGEHALPARMRTANAIAKQGRLDEALDYLRRIDVEDPDQQAQLLVAQAQLLRDAGRDRDAFKLLGEGLEKTPGQPELLYDYALTAERLGRYDVLESSLRRLIKEHPDYAHAYNALGYSLADRDTRLPEARKLIEKALELSPQDYYIVDSMGWVLYREGDLKGALKELRRAYRGRPDPEIGAHLGEVLWVMGDRTEADRVWQESLKASPSNETLKQTIRRFQQ